MEGRNTSAFKTELSWTDWSEEWRLTKRWSMISWIVLRPNLSSFLQGNRCPLPQSIGWRSVKQESQISKAKWQNISYQHYLFYFLLLRLRPGPEMDVHHVLAWSKMSKVRHFLSLLFLNIFEFDFLIIIHKYISFIRQHRNLALFCKQELRQILDIRFHTSFAHF